MNRIKNYFINQSQRGGPALAYDFVMVGGFLACFYFGFVH